MKKLIHWLPTLAWAALIFFFSSRQTVKTTDFYLTDFLIKKSAHFIEYAILSLLVYRSLRLTTTFSRRKLFFISLILAVSYAASDEIHQTLVPTREGRVRDVIIDSAGILTALITLRSRV